MLKSINLKSNFYLIFRANIIGQLFQIIAIPILARFFSKNEFGLFASFMTLNSILLTFITGKYELSLLILDNQKLKNGFVATLLLSLIVFTILMILTLFESIVVVANSWISVSVLLSSIFTGLFVAFVTLFSELLLRLGELKGYSLIKMVNPILVSIFSFIFGFYSLSNGMIYGFMLGTFISFVIQVVIVKRLKFFNNISFDLKEIKKFYLKYIKFPLYYTPGQLLNSLVGFVPVFFITKLSGTTFLGLFFMADRLGSIFTNTFGTSLRDHFRLKAVDKISKGELFKYHLNYTGRLVLLVSMFISILYFLSFYLPVILGRDWSEIGQVFRILLIYFFFQFVNMPTSSVLVLLESQKIDFIWQLFYLISTVMSFYFFKSGVDFIEMMCAFALIRACVYLVQIVLTLYLSFKSDILNSYEPH